MLNIRNIQMITFEDDGSPTLYYAIRKGWIFHEYLDLTAYKRMYFWWDKSKAFFRESCTSNDYEKVKSILLDLRLYKSKETVIKNP